MGRLTCSLRFQLPSSSCSRPLPVFVFFSPVLCKTFRALRQPCSQQLSSQQPATLCRPLPTSWRQLCGDPCPSSSAFLPQVILKDLEVLAEIASSPAGQTDDLGPLDGPDLRISHSELQVPTPGRASLLPTPSKYSPMRPTSGILGTSALGLVLDWGCHP